MNFDYNCKKSFGEFHKEFASLRINKKNNPGKYEEKCHGKNIVLVDIRRCYRTLEFK